MALHSTVPTADTSASRRRRPPASRRDTRSDRCRRRHSISSRKASEPRPRTSPQEGAHTAAPTLEREDGRPRSGHSLRRHIATGQCDRHHLQITSTCTHAGALTPPHPSGCPDTPTPTHPRGCPDTSTPAAAPTPPHPGGCLPSHTSGAPVHLQPLPHRRVASPDTLL